MGDFPKDCNSRVIGSKARQCVHGAFDAEHWEYHEQTGNDHGIDCILELIEDSEYHNHKIEGQIKGTRVPKEIKDDCFSFPFDVKTIYYGLSSSNAFVLFLVDVDNKIVYYLPIQEYFIAHPDLFDRIEKTNQRLTFISLKIIS